MEADWSVEIGGESARIEVEWSGPEGAGFVDLRRDAALVDRIAETREHSALRTALRELNGGDSPVFTSKCDVWTMAEAEIDPLEFDCEAARAGLACYIDVIARDEALFGSFEQHEAWVRRATMALRGERLRRGRVDLVVRSAVAGGADGFGVTLYAVGCGEDSSAAEAAWGEVLQAAVIATIREVGASSSIG